MTETPEKDDETRPFLPYAFYVILLAIVLTIVGDAFVSKEILHTAREAPGTGTSGPPEFFGFSYTQIHMTAYRSGFVLFLVGIIFWIDSTFKGKRPYHFLLTLISLIYIFFTFFLMV